jgi:hypothetical protein
MPFRSVNQCGALEIGGSIGDIFEYGLVTRVESGCLAERAGFEPAEPCGSPDFESGTFDHSATSPGVSFGGSYRGGILAQGRSWPEQSNATHVRPQYLRHRNRAVSVLTVLKYGDERASYGESRTIESVHKFVFP